MKLGRILSFLLLLPMLSYAANVPPPGQTGNIITNNGNGQYGAYAIGNNLSTSTSGGQTFLNSTATGSSAALSVSTSNQTFYLPFSATTTSSGLTNLYSGNLFYNPSTSTLSVLGLTTTNLNAVNAALTGTITASGLSSGTVASYLGINSSNQVVLGSGSSATLSNTTSNQSFFLGFTTSTSGTLSTLYGNATGLFFNPSTGTLNATAITTTTLDFTNALGTTITATNIEGTNAALSGTLTAANLDVTGTATENNALITTLTVTTCHGCVSGAITNIGIGTGGISSTQSPLTSTGTLSILPATSTSPGSVIISTGLNVSATGVVTGAFATTTSLGEIIVGNNLSISSTGVLSATSSSSFPSQSGHAFQYLSTNGTAVNWLNPASLVDPRTYGASCVGPGYTGGVGSTLIVTAGTSYTTGTYTAVPLTGGAGSGAQATIIVSGGAVTTVTVTAAGSGYKLRDQLSASAASIGGTGSGFVTQVQSFSANQTPTYDGVHDDTAAFETAMAVAQNTGQGVLVPNGCWIGVLNVPPGVVMIGTGWAPTYDFDDLGGTADAMPVLYVEPGTSNGIFWGLNPQNGFVGFEVNGTAAYQTQYCLGTNINSGGGSPQVYIHFMSFKGCLAGVGSSSTSPTMFVHSDHTDYGTNFYGMRGHLSDLDSEGDTFSSNNTGIYWTGFGGQSRISHDRFEYGNVGINLQQFVDVIIDNTQFDHMSSTGLLIGTISGTVLISNSSFEASGNSASQGNEAHITLSRTTSGPVDLHISNTKFATDSTNTFPKYVLEVTTTGTFNNGIYFDGGDATTGFSTAFGNYVNGQPPIMQFDIAGNGVTGYNAVQGKNANGNFPAQSRGLPANQWSNLYTVGDISMYNYDFPESNSWPQILGKNMGTSPTLLGEGQNSFSKFDCDLVNDEIVPNVNAQLQDNGVVVWLPGLSDTDFGSGFYQGHEQDTNSCRLGALTFMTVPQQYTAYAQSAAWTSTGSWTNSASYTGYYGITSGTNGNTAAGTIQTYGGPIYLWYLMQGNNGGTFTWQLDNTTTGSVAVEGNNQFTFPISTSSQTLGAIRIPVINNAGSHTVNVTITSTTTSGNSVTIEGIGTPPAKGYHGSSPTVYLGGQLGLLTTSAGFPAANNAFNNDQMFQANELQADGLGATFVNVLNYVNNPNDYLSNAELNYSGFGHIADAFSGAMQYIPIDGYAVDPKNFGASCNTTALVGNGYYGGGTYQLNATAGSPIITINGYRPDPATATQNGGGDVGKVAVVTCGNDEGPTTYVLSATSTSLTLGENMAINCGPSASNSVVLLSGYPSNPNNPATAHDDTIAIQNAAQAAVRGGGYVALPNNCMVHDLRPPQYTAIVGNQAGTNYGNYWPPTNSQGNTGSTSTILYVGDTGFADDVDASTGIARDLGIDTGYASSGTLEFRLSNVQVNCPNFPYLPQGQQGSAIGQKTRGSGNNPSNYDISPNHVVLDNVAIVNCPTGLGPPLSWNHATAFTATISGTTMDVLSFTSTGMSNYGGAGEILAIGQTITGPNLSGTTTITSAPVGAGVGNYGISLAATETTSSSYTTVVPAMVMSGTIRNSFFGQDGIGVNGDMSDMTFNNDIFTGSYVGQIYEGPQTDGFGSSANRIIGGRMETSGFGLLIDDSFSTIITGMQFEFLPGGAIKTINNWGGIQVTGDWLVGNGSSNGSGDRANIYIGGSGKGFDVTGSYFQAQQYMLETATGSTADDITIQGGYYQPGQTYTIAPFQFKNQTPTHYRIDMGGYEKIDTMVIPTISGLSITSTTGSIYSGSGIAGVTTGSGILTLSGLPAAPNSWNCQGGDATAGNTFAMSSTTSTSCALSGSTTNTDVIWYQGTAH